MRRGNRTGLWFDIAEIVGDLHPSWVVLENVAQLARRGLDQVTHDLARLGYVGRWGTFTAAAVGAPHKRARLFLLASHTDSVRRTGWAHSGGAVQQTVRIGSDTAGSGTRHQWEPSPAYHQRVPPRDHLGKYEEAVVRWEHQTRPAPPLADQWGRVIPEFTEWMMGLPPGWVTDLEAARRPMLRIIGNSVVPQQAVHALQRLSALLEK